MPARRSEEARAVDDVGTPFENGLQQHRVLARVVLEVGVLDDDDVAGGFADAASHRGALALVLALQQDADAVAPVELGEDVPRPIARPVVDDDEFLFDAGESTARTRATISRMVARSL